MTDIFINEKFVGTVEDPKDFIKQIRAERRKGTLSQELNFFYDDEYNEVYMTSTKGRARRPLIVVESGKPKLQTEQIEGLKNGSLKWDRLVKDGILEYIDAAEEENCLIALDESEITKEHTHLEISTAAILGLCTSLIPYSNFVG